MPIPVILLLLLALVVTVQQLVVKICTVRRMEKALIRINHSGIDPASANAEEQADISYDALHPGVRCVASSVEHPHGILPAKLKPPSPRTAVDVDGIVQRAVQEYLNGQSWDDKNSFPTALEQERVRWEELEQSLAELVERNQSQTAHYLRMGANAV
jgi:hypothetical protein